MQNREGERPDILTHLYTHVPVSRRRLGIAGAIAVGKFLLDTRPVFAGGGGEPPKEQRSRILTDEEKQRLTTQAAEHDQRTQATMEEFFNRALLDKYGYQVKPTDIAKTLDKQQLTPSPNDPYTISSEVQLSSVNALGTYSSSFYDRADFGGSSLDIYIPRYGDYSHYIPELDSLVTQFARGQSQILEADMGTALHTAFALPANTQELGFLDPDQRFWEGKASDGRLLRAYVNRNRRLGIFLR